MREKHFGECKIDIYQNLNNPFAEAAMAVEGGEKRSLQALAERGGGIVESSAGNANLVNEDSLDLLTATPSLRPAASKALPAHTNLLHGK